MNFTSRTALAVSFMFLICLLLVPSNASATTWCYDYFETGMDGWTKSSGTTFAQSSDISQSGAYSLKVVSATGSTDVSANPRPFSYEVDYYVWIVNPQGTYIWKAKNETNTQIELLTQDAAGQARIDYCNKAVGYTSTGITVSTGAWHHINVKMVNFLWCNLTVDGGSTVSIPGSSFYYAGTGGATDFWFSAGGAGGAYYDSLIVTTSLITAPTADFTVDDTTPTTDQTVTFTDASSWGGEIASRTYQWDFTNDGSVDSTAISPTHVYDTAGTYSVSLKVINSVGNDTETKLNYIVVTGPTGGNADLNFYASWTWLFALIMCFLLSLMCAWNGGMSIDGTIFLGVLSVCMAVMAWQSMLPLWILIFSAAILVYLIYGRLSH